MTTASPGSFLIYNFVDKMFQVVIDNDWFRQECKAWEGKSVSLFSMKERISKV